MKTPGFLFLTIAICFISLSRICAQPESRFWYFGDHTGLDFATVPPTPLYGTLSTTEGCSSISDASGNLLFYTNGVYVYDKTHVIMSNGALLGGHQSSSQSALIVQLPGSTSIYYIFTAPEATSAYKQLDYSIVDIRLNGGKGAVTVKNAVLYSPASEKCAGVRHANGNDIWILAHDYATDGFMAYLLTPSGVVTTPVNSNAGISFPGWYERGVIKFNLAGTKVAMGTEDDFIELFDFDNTTGIVSNSRHLTIPGTGVASTYGISFSPNGKYLYATDVLYKRLYQWDITSGIDTVIAATRQLIYTGVNQFGDVQLAPDGKIYLASFNNWYLGAINEPDKPGLLCNFDSAAIFLAGHYSEGGLPNNIASIYRGFSVNNICAGDSSYFTIALSFNCDSVEWNFDDPLSGVYNLSSAMSPSHFFAATGIHHVQLIKYNKDGSTDTVMQAVTINSALVDLGADTTICTGDTLLLNASGYDSYTWQNGDTDSTYNVSAAGQYWLTVSKNDCVYTDTITVNITACNGVPVVNIQCSDTSFCEKKCLDFFDLSTNNPTSWQWFFQGADSISSTLQNPSNICYNTYGSFDVTLIACNTSGCDTLLLPGFINEYPTPIPVITQSNDTLLSSPGYTYQWWSVSGGIIAGATNSYFVPTQGGDYFVMISDSIGCAGTSNVITITGINANVLPGLPLWIAPNPGNGNFKIKLSTAINSDFSIQVTDIFGADVKRILIEKRNNDVFEIQFDYVAKGLYAVKIINDGKVYNCRLIIQ